MVLNCSKIIIGLKYVPAYERYSDPLKHAIYDDIQCKLMHDHILLIKIRCMSLKCKCHNTVDARYVDA